ncbi:hypothetical protein L195_g043031, partial [Trifolium pratense]
MKFIVIFVALVGRWTHPSTCTSLGETTSSGGAIWWMKLMGFEDEGNEIARAIELDNLR